MNSGSFKWDYCLSGINYGHVVGKGTGWAGSDRSGVAECGAGLPLPHRSPSRVGGKGH